MYYFKNLIKKILPPFLIDWYHWLLSLIGAIIYRFPSRNLIVIGVTGTGGKSTVVDFIAGILEEAGYKTASLSSIKFKICRKEWPNALKMTMPGRFNLQKFLRQAVDVGCQYAVLEVTSEGIKQHRHRFIDFSVAVFTNLTPEHIESHGSFERYREAKTKLFRAAKDIHILNLDDENVEYFLKYPAKKKYGYTTMNSEQRTMNAVKSLRFHEAGSEQLSIVYCSLFVLRPNGISFEVQNTKFNLNMLGGFNVSNALAAICVSLSQGISLEICKKALEKIDGIPGRMEIVIDKPFTVIVDYAHTPDALEKVYQTLQGTMNKEQRTKMICVLGAAGGGRDKWKRPELGKIAAQYCDEIIITNEDPYDENPTQILSEIKSGISNSQFSISNLYEILDRREAIKKALFLAKPNDVVIITGKGCEPWMCVAAGKKISWDDRRIVREEFSKISNNGIT